MTDDLDSFSFRFTATGAGPPLAIRVRRMLKHALRATGLRAEILCSNELSQLKPARPKGISEDPMSFHVHVDKDGPRGCRDDGDDESANPQAVSCVKVTIGPGVTRTEALRWLGQAMREVGESYQPAGDGDEQLVGAAAGEVSRR